MLRRKGRAVPPRSTAAIRDFALKMRGLLAVLGAPPTGALNIIDVIEKYLPLFLPDFEFEVLEDQELGNDAARTYPDQSRIEIKKSTYDGARRGDGFCIFTLGHEVGHLLLHRGTATFARSIGNRECAIYCDSEWQADSFSAELLMPYSESCVCVSVEEIQRRFGVSYSAAEVRFRKTRKK